MKSIQAVLCTCPDEATARRLARALVEKRLAACVNVFPAVASIYRWEGAVEEAQEALMMIKTAADKLEPLERWLANHHPYDVPEVVALDAAYVAEPYQRWLLAAVEG